MRKLTYVAIALCLVSLSLGCAEEQVSVLSSGSITETVIPAPSLRGNLIGDPTEQRMSIYLPPGYSESPDKRYPVLYLLHGFTGTNRTWLVDPDSSIKEPAVDSRDGGYQQAGFLESERMDALITGGTIPELIIVAPNGRNAYKHSFYVNSSVTGRWEDYIVEDVVSFVDANYRTLPVASSRGIAGHSGGANGAFFIAMRHSDIFGSVYAMAPCCSGQTFSLPPLEDPDTGLPTPFWNEVYTRIHSISTTDELSNTFTDRREDFYVSEELAASVAYTPNPEREPLYSDYLFEMRNGALVLNDDALERRLALSVFRLIDQHESDLRSLRGILIDYGENEMHDLVAGNSELAEALAKRGIPFTLEVYAGGDHGNMIAERLESHGLRFFAGSLQFSDE